MMFKNPTKLAGTAVGGFLASAIFLAVTLGLDRTEPSSATRYLVTFFCFTGALSLVVWAFASFAVWDGTRKK
jgi:hypothetical protein